MDDVNNKLPLISLVKRHGISKVGLVVLCLLCFGVFTAYVLNGFVDMLIQQCYSSFPYLACDGTGSFLGTIGVVGASTLGPLLTFNWLLNRSFLFLFGTLISIFLATMFGGTFLKNRYERMVQTQ